MKRTIFAIVLALVVGAAQAHDYTVGSLQIAHPWTRATPKGASVAGGFLKITNIGATADRLVGASSPVAARGEIHEMAMVEGIMRMRPLAAGLEIKGGQTIELKPGSYHIMFMDLKRPLEKGERIKGTLSFERAGSIEVEFVVEAMGARTSGDGMGH